MFCLERCPRVFQPYHLRFAVLHIYSVPAFLNQDISRANTFPILVTNGTTNAFPIQKYLIFSGIPVSVQPSGKPFSRSHSTGVNVRNRPVTMSVTTWDVLPTWVSDVSIVRDGLYNGSGNCTLPSLNQYSLPSILCLRSFYAPFAYIHFGMSSSCRKCCSPTLTFSNISRSGIKG